jgi:hypothetical protein
VLELELLGKAPRRDQLVTSVLALTGNHQPEDKAQSLCEFGLKISLAARREQGMVRARSFSRNPYMSHVLIAQLTHTMNFSPD